MSNKLTSVVWMVFIITALTVTVNQAGLDELLQKAAKTLQSTFSTGMSEVGVTRQYQSLESEIKAMPLVGGSVVFDLDSYVTGKALDGLFFVLAQEEAKIRKDPSARVTDLLKKVFR